MSSPRKFNFQRKKIKKIEKNLACKCICIYSQFFRDDSIYRFGNNFVSNCFDLQAVLWQKVRFAKKYSKYMNKKILYNRSSLNRCLYFNNKLSKRLLFIPQISAILYKNQKLKTWVSRKSFWAYHRRWPLKKISNLTDLNWTFEKGNFGKGGQESQVF